MKITSIVVLLAVLVLSTTAYDLSMFYCGFGGDFCGQSTDDDTNPSTTLVILAFVNTNSDGSVTIDDANFPWDLVNKWQIQQGKGVIISVGGQNGNWMNVFASSTSITNFVNSVKQILDDYQLDGVDLDIENYNATPLTVANAIIQLKEAIRPKIIVVSPEAVAVYQGTTVPDQNTAGQAFNYFVPIINLADSHIDFYQPQAYNNWYEEAAGSLKYLQNVYLNWRNYNGTGPWDTALPNFKGVDGNKLLMGVLASPSAGGAAYYQIPDTIAQFKSWLSTNSSYTLRGFMMWDSHWDKLNGYAVSNACIA